VTWRAAGEVRPLRGLASSGGLFLFRYSRNRTHICFISSKMLYQSAIYLKNISLWVRLTCYNFKMGRPRNNRVCVRSMQSILFWDRFIFGGPRISLKRDRTSNLYVINISLYRLSYQTYKTILLGRLTVKYLLFLYSWACGRSHTSKGSLVLGF
jgi:hypothetical protein